jgi:hypothetical protein
MMPGAAKMSNDRAGKARAALSVAVCASNDLTGSFICAAVCGGMTYRRRTFFHRQRRRSVPP